MAYNWNKMVTITVPVGLNGWLYSGQITINGIVTKFPVGVETNLPEPVAAMIQQMIAVEEDNKVQTPDNLHTGSVTIPAGKKLKLEAGALVEDEAGVLGTGGGGGTSTVVVLDETTLTGEGELALGTPFNVQPEVGKTYNVTYNGTPYDCPGVAQNLGGVMGVLLGNAELAEGSGGNTEAPFTIIVIPPAYVDQFGAYAAIYDASGATSVTLSITTSADQVGTSSGNSGPLFITADIGFAAGAYVLNSISATYAEILAAINSGRDVICITAHDLDETGTGLNGRSLLRLVMFGDDNIVLSCRNAQMRYEVSILMMANGTNLGDVKEI